MLAPVGGTKTQSTSSTPTTTSSTSTDTTSTGTASTKSPKSSGGVDLYTTRSSGEEIPQICGATRSSGEEIPQVCSVGGVSSFSLTAADFSAQ